ncbi:MAG: hypothetical protein HC892_09855 [Saprospiraceae bacterium]|nr:hypothetical protein [Saprospiraceae bacterium]
MNNAFLTNEQMKTDEKFESFLSPSEIMSAGWVKLYVVPGDGLCFGKHLFKFCEALGFFVFLLSTLMLMLAESHYYPR